MPLSWACSRASPTGRRTAGALAGRGNGCHLGLALVGNVLVEKRLNAIQIANLPSQGLGHCQGRGPLVFGCRPRRAGKALHGDEVGSVFGLEQPFVIGRNGGLDFDVHGRQRCEVLRGARRGEGRVAGGQCSRGRSWIRGQLREDRSREHSGHTHRQQISPAHGIPPCTLDQGEITSRMAGHIPLIPVGCQRKSPELLKCLDSFCRTDVVVLDRFRARIR